MKKPKPPKQRTTRQFWESLTDEQLLDVELTTHNPESLEDLVTEFPPGDEEPYVEYKYDLRGSGREKEFTCVHGHHKHLAGYVMRKGDKRFLVGWICGNSIYGEVFDEYTADFDAAVNRQSTLRRRRDIENALKPFMVWLQQVAASNVFKHRESIQDQLAERMVWIWDNMPRASYLDARLTGGNLPATLFNDDVDPEEEFAAIVSDVSALALNLVARQDLQEISVDNIRRRMEVFIRRIEVVLDQLKEVEDFFQPSVLALVCRLANEHDNPKKRTYEAGLMSITCKRDRNKITIQIPKNFALPSRRPIEQLRAAILGIQSTA